MKIKHRTTNALRTQMRNQPEQFEAKWFLDAQEEVRRRRRISDAKRKARKKQAKKAGTPTSGPTAGKDVKSAHKAKHLRRSRQSA